MHSSALSMPSTGNVHREKSDRNRFARSRSQPPADNLGSFLSMPHMPSNTPMKSFIENLLHLTPHRHLSMSNALTTRTKVGSSLGTNLPTDHSSRIKLPNPSSFVYTPSSSEARVWLCSLAVNISCLPASSLRRLNWRENFVEQAN